MAKRKNPSVTGILNQKVAGIPVMVIGLGVGAWWLWKRQQAIVGPTPGTTVDAR